MHNECYLFKGATQPASAEQDRYDYCTGNHVVMLFQEIFYEPKPDTIASIKVFLLRARGIPFRLFYFRLHPQLFGTIWRPGV
jgi:hypothetical protein